MRYGARRKSCVDLAEENATMSDLTDIEVLLKRLNKELNQKLECSAEEKRELEMLIAEIASAHRHEVSQAKKGALIYKALTLLGAIVKCIPEIRDFLGGGG
tara:strand:- start:161 stop:463 length:303 start_codon:yes stop_codon:yes gene_type:complete